MKFTKLLYKINWKLITVHLVATFFIVLATRQFLFLNDLKIIELVDKFGAEESVNYFKKDPSFTPSRIAYFLLWIQSYRIIGIFIAFIISLSITIKKNVFWINALIVFLSAILLNRLGMYNNRNFNNMFSLWDLLVSNFGFQYKYIANGTILTITGFFIFFSKWTNNFALNCQTNKTDAILNNK